MKAKEKAAKKNKEDIQFKIYSLFYLPLFLLDRRYGK